ncbi:MAG: hypothetical protein ACT4PU_11430 [Planctomycetota bacterium]
MALIHLTFPSSSYNILPAPPYSLDQIELEVPYPPPQAPAQSTVRIKVKANSAQNMQQVVVTIGLTRAQVITNVETPPGPPQWAVTAPVAWERKWSAVPGSGGIPNGQERTFGVVFTTQHPGLYRFTFRVQAGNLAGAFETTYDYVVI